MKIPSNNNDLASCCFRLIDSERFDSLIKAGARTFLVEGLTLRQQSDLKKTFAQLEYRKGLTREELTIVLRLAASELGSNREYDYQGWSKVMELSCRSYAKGLGVTYFDALTYSSIEGCRQSKGSQEIVLEEVWPQMELVYALGLTKSLATSDFGPLELQRLLRFAVIPPKANLLAGESGYPPYFSDFCAAINVQNLLEVPHSDSEIQEATFSSTREGIVSGKQPVVSLPRSTTAGDHRDEGDAIARASVPLSQERLAVTDIPASPDAVGSVLSSATSTEPTRRKFSRQAALIPSCPEYHFRLMDSYERDFLSELTCALTDGPGYIVAKDVFSAAAKRMQKLKMPEMELRWSGVNEHDPMKLAINRCNDVVDLIDDRLIAPIVESLLGWDCLIDNMAFSTSKAFSGCFGPHQDSPFEQNPGAILPPRSYPLSIQCIFCIDDFTADNGAFYVIPDSHKSQLRVNLPSQGNLPRDVVPVNAQLIAAQAGDVIIAVGNVWHGALPNKTRTDRRSLLVQYVSSIIDIRDKISADKIRPDILRSLSPRALRLLGGNKHYRGTERDLLVAWNRLQQEDFRLSQCSSPRA